MYFILFFLIVEYLIRSIFYKNKYLPFGINQKKIKNNKNSYEVMSPCPKLFL